MYDHAKIDAKWHKRWSDTRLYATTDNQTKPKRYVLDMFPYPSGAGLHVGHPKGYIATDVVARQKLMQGFAVLHPMGWDAFGLPAENYALANKIHPARAVEKNIQVFKKQLEKIGFAYDWDREINTTDPSYYRWTQWAFVQMFKHGLAYESYEPINWCPSCKTGLAQEDLENGRCERCGSEIERKPLRQWVIKITAYAERLLNDLEKLPAWEESIKEMQRAWIGKSEGAEINFAIKDQGAKIRIFTTRLDTIFGCTYLVLAPEHPLIDDASIHIANRDTVKSYRDEAIRKTDLARAESKEKTGVRLEGVEAINPFTGTAVPIFVADYVLAQYGTGAVMAVPAHDERDWEFAQNYDLPIKTVIHPRSQAKNIEEASADEGHLVESGPYTGLSSVEAREKMIAWATAQGHGDKSIKYKIRDWVFSRQRYWGEPIPIIHCQSCGAVPVPEHQLPVTLPAVDHYEPTGTGESPLASIESWVNTVCPQCGGPGKRETNTMPQWAGSSWYYLRYIDPHNPDALVDREKERYWSPVDVYVGGAEHATRHLIYARFWHKFLFDIGAVSTDEPFTRLQHVGLIMGEDGRKMSKRYGNVINPDDVIERVGADALRVYEMFMGPFAQSIAWNTNGLAGARRFLEKVWRIRNSVSDSESAPNAALESLAHKTIKKVSDDIEQFKFNTAISSLMILANALDEADGPPRAIYETLLLLLSPFAPHIAEELWESLGHTGSIFATAWPAYSAEKIKDTRVKIVIQVNGKVRDTMEVSPDTPSEELVSRALEREAVAKWLGQAEVKKTIVIPNKIINIVA